MKKLFLVFTLFFAIFAQASVVVSVNGANHTIPETNERGWGSAVTAWIQAISANTLQPTGGTFTLSQDVNFGGSYGLKSQYFATRSANPATLGTYRLSVGDLISWRNNANGANLSLGVNASDKLVFDGVVLATSSDGEFKDSGFSIVDASDNSIAVTVNAGGTASTSTALVFAQTTNRSIAFPDATTTLVGDDTTQTLQNKELDSATVTGGGDVVGSTSTQTLTNKTIDADSNTVSNIADAQIKAGAAIARSKLASGANYRVVTNNGSGVMADAAAITAARALISDANGIPTHSSITSTELGYLTGITSGVATLGDAQVFTASKEFSGQLKASGLFVGNVQADTTAGANQTLPTPTKVIMRSTGALTSIAGVPSLSVNAVVVWMNVTGGNVAVLNESGSASATDRILTGTGANLTVKDGGMILLVRDTTTQRWRVSGGGGGAARSVLGSTGTPVDIVAASGITSSQISTSETDQLIFIKGSVAATECVVSAGTYIAAHTVVGATLEIHGTSNTAPVTFDGGTAFGVALKGLRQLNQYSVLKLTWNGTLWQEVSWSE